MPGFNEFYPVVVPVHNLGAGGNTPPFWLPPPRGIGWRHAMFNAYFLRDGYTVALLGDLVAWVDSGGFLFLEAPQRRLAGLHGFRPGSRGGRLSAWSEELVVEVLRRQEGFGASVAFTLDYPLPARSQVEPECCPSTVMGRVRATAAAAGLAYQLRRRGSMKILVVLQYNSISVLDRLLGLLQRELRVRAGIGLEDVDGFAVGGLVPHSGKWWLLVRRLQEARRRLGWSVHIHILGVASPHNLPLLYLAGADSMDSKTYIIAAAKRLYYRPPGVRPARIQLGRDSVSGHPRDYCGCYVCRMAESFEELRSTTRLLALHNLYVMLSAARSTGNAYLEGRLYDYVGELAKGNPRLIKALQELKEPRPPTRV